MSQYYVYIPDDAKPENDNVTVQLSQWLHTIGEPIHQGDDLVEICTDKATYIVPAPVSGILSKILIEEGQTFNPNDPICIIDTNTN